MSALSSRTSPDEPIRQGLLRRHRGLLPWAAIGAAATLMGTSCGDQNEETSAASGTAEVDAQLSVVASIDVYANLAAQIAGDTAEIEAIVDNPAIDPHSYEASPQDRLRIEQADVLIANGGGYDTFLSTLAESADKDDVLIQVLSGSEDEEDHDDEDTDDAHGPVEDHAEHDDSHDGEAPAHDSTDSIHEEGRSGHSDEENHDEDAEHREGEDDHSGHGHGEDGENEHVWYDLALMSEFVTDLADHLAEISPENAELYSDNAETLAAEIDTLNERNRSLEASGMTFMTTEPVSTYLLSDAGFEDQTDADFLAAIEHGDDVSPRLLQDALATAEDIDVLVYNEQTETNQSQQIRQAAEEAGVPVVEFSETLPEEAEDYLDWMDTNINQLEELLSSPSL
ncbi:metal ABC transporter substrate-binding protein [Nesterenkonia sphaerica]|uniref:ABC transporter substrate-binding protein n=1 Tax=Nesterenkonia sphaerica TaxID=1804988 RepID=A0A5R9A131_9MICC|nr:metal ABC transporter substrate-binding protein [Nesterenkonia sphaerica]TLP71914.1 ABC transporter substrate-binding protein [Nesterenkonia sphaerica]